jgi:hypothetical protein
MDYFETIKEREEKREFWVNYAKSILLNSRATYSEYKTAIIGVRSYDPGLAGKLDREKGRPPSYG